MKKNTDPRHLDLHAKINAFHRAMEKYGKNKLYRYIERTTSIMVVGLQIMTCIQLIRMLPENHPLIILLPLLILAYLTTDLISGLVHMFMDNNTHYTSVVGPFIAAFHLHHTRLRYTYTSAISVYFYESGVKFWLVGYLWLLFGMQCTLPIPYSLNVFLVAIGIFSSLAEVSHYWCHNTTEKNTILTWLQARRILLSKKHHLLHHRCDNTHYAFLNGVTDPLINILAQYWYPGYKNHADEHTAAYIRKKPLRD